MRWTTLTSAVSLAVLLAAPASAALSDFRLPEGSTQQPAPDQQGPVAPDVPESRRPAPTPAPTASREPAPAPQIVVPDIGEQTPAPERTTAAPVAAASRPAVERPVVTTGSPLPEAAPSDSVQLPPAAAAPTAAAPATSIASPAEAEGGLPWLLILGGLAALSAFAFLGWLWRQRRPVSRPAKVPQVERPSPAPEPAPAAPAVAPFEPLQVTLEPLRLSLTLLNATLAYRLEIANRGTAPIAGLSVGADMISAHASMTREEQLSGPGDGAATVRRIERLEPGESRIVEGEFRLPFPQIVPIRQGNAALLVPLARFRLETDGAAPVVRTFAVGESGPKAGLQPFRLDLGPRVYPKLTQRAFA